MTAPDLTALADKLDELAMKATTRGPWKVTNGGLGIEGEPDAASDFDPVVIGGCKGGKGLIDFPSYGIYSTPGRKEGEANAALIVALRNALPQITTALREAARLREAEAFVEFFDAHEAKLEWEGSHYTNDWAEWRRRYERYEAALKTARIARAALKQEESRG